MYAKCPKSAASRAMIIYFQGVLKTFAQCVQIYEEKQLIQNVQSHGQHVCSDNGVTLFCLNSITAALQ